MPGRPHTMPDNDEEVQRPVEEANNLELLHGNKHYMHRLKAILCYGCSSDGVNVGFKGFPVQV